jgi:hypothetical protein
MGNFKYCIWLTPSDGEDEWYSYTNGCEPHITIFYHLEEDEAIEKLKLINNCDIEVSLGDEQVHSSDNGFHSLYYHAYPIEKPDWWPNNAHVSFYYKYADIDKEEMDALTQKIIKKNSRFSTIKIKKCNGHFLEW